MSDRDQWARETLGLPAGMDLTAARCLLLEQLAQQDWSPSPVWQDALADLIATVIHPSPPASVSYCLANEGRARQSLKQFATAFFSFDPQSRRRHWSELKELCDPWPPLRQWLQQLEPGLDVTLPTADATSADIGDLVKYLSKRFTACPGVPSNEPWQELETTFAKIGHWRTKAWKFRRLHPALATLFDPWIPTITQRPSRLLQRLHKPLPNLFHVMGYLTGRIIHSRTFKTSMIKTGIYGVLFAIAMILTLLLAMVLEFFHLK